ncbi:biotinidase-like, partial [Stegodyphus dumicola]|uniref:biotinidase-like n=1 Tax=Stegodyphus dumicola TaxID=202533 RepID=UPI0015AAD9E6
EADIIVFPEWGLHPHEKQNRSSINFFVEDIPDPRYGFYNPCNQTDQFNNYQILTKLSCIAKETGMFIIANMVDKKKCKISETCDVNNIESCAADTTSCPDDGVLFHNTNVVFNRDGTLIARYYKRHLYFEADMNPLKNNEDIYFETDFGKFTTFVCFDLSFKESVTAVEKADVINVAYPTYWFDHTPFAWATPFQQSWAITNKVNLLAANVHHPGTGTLGSGIYSPSGALIYTHNPDGLSKILISNVPKSYDDDVRVTSIPLNPKRFIIKNSVAVEVANEESTDFDNVCGIHVLGLPKDPSRDYRCLPSNVTRYLFQKLNGNKGDLELCSGRICCSLSYQADSIDEDYYFGVSGEDFNFYNSFSFGIESCFMARCESLNGSHCSNFLVHSHTVFQSVKLRGNFSTKYVYPFSVNSGLRLSTKDEWSFDLKSEISYTNLHKNISLLFFGLYGRRYDLDKIFY